MMQRSAMMIRLVTSRRRLDTKRLLRGAATRVLKCSSFHSTPPSHAAAPKSKTTDTRLAGRLRFYKSVGVAPVEAPWESSTENNAIDSPISAGVDETQSASGVSSAWNTETSHIQQALTPRQPNTFYFTKKSNWFGVTLDGRSIKTPLGQTLAVPSENLAWAIAAEWDAQKKYLQPAQMPLMTLACTALDQTSTISPADEILRYLSTDTISFWADPSEDRVLYRKQQQSWQGLHEWAEQLLGAKPACAIGASEGLLMSRARDNKSSGLPHPPSLEKAAQDWVNTLDAWHLTCMYSVTAEAKSFLVGMALLESAYRDNVFSDEVSKAILAARVEEEFQIDNWGLVEGGHDYDRLNCSVQMHSSHFFISAIANEYFL